MNCRRWVILIAALATSNPAAACQCGRLPTTREALATSTAVFEGTVVRRWPELHRDIDFGGLIPTQRYVFAVRRSWKGTAQPSIELLQGASNCSWRFVTGRTYLVFAVPHESEHGELDAFLCAGPTGESAMQSKHIQALGPPRITFAPRIEMPGLLESARQHVAVYFWCGVAAVAALFQRPSFAGGWIVIPAVLFAVALVACLFGIRRSVSRPLLRRSLIAVLLPSLSVAFLLVVGYLFVQHEHLWFQHLLEGWDGY